MFRSATDKHWEQYGKAEPYFGVFTTDDYLNKNLTEEKLAEFFRSGEVQIDFTVDEIKRHIDPDFAPRRCMDFGCGVGRLVIPLARRFESAVGVDVSPSMLEEAKRKCREANLENASFVESDDTLSRVTGKFDFIHSYIVFHHIPVPRGMALMKRLIELMNPDGVAAIQFIYAEDIAPFQRFKNWILRRSSAAMYLWCLLKGRSTQLAPMQFNRYSFNSLFNLLERNGCDRAYLRLMRMGPHAGSAILMFQKRRGGNPLCDSFNATA